MHYLLFCSGEVFVMGEYKVNWDSNEIVVDGHRCVQEQPGIYRVQDKYLVNDDDWERDKRNVGLRAIALFNGDGMQQEVVYVCRPIPYVVIQAAKLMPRDRPHVTMYCMYPPDNEPEVLNLSLF